MSTYIKNAAKKNAKERTKENKYVKYECVEYYIMNSNQSSIKSRAFILWKLRKVIKRDG